MATSVRCTRRRVEAPLRSERGIVRPATDQDVTVNGRAEGWVAMRVLFIGGTGNISTPVSRLCVERGFDLVLLNRGRREVAIPRAHTIHADIADAAGMRAALAGLSWDAVVDWIAFSEEDIERDIELFRGATTQFVFISTAAAYLKPPPQPVIVETSPLANAHWEYARKKIACEARLQHAHRDEGFPATIVRPSHTYDTVIPVPIGGWTEYTLIDRLRSGRKVIIHDRGTSLWTMTHAEDFAKGLVGLLGLESAVGEVFHITSDEVITWNEIYGAIADAAGCALSAAHVPTVDIVAAEPSLEGTLLGDKALDTVFDNGKIKRFVPEFAATIPFREGITKTLAWFEADPKRRIVNPATHEKMDRIIRHHQQLQS
jgi:nucleoside-diphosphate-sugar epimerase